MSLSLALQTALHLPIPIRRELILLAAALVLGLVAAPPLVWMWGSRALGPYGGGGIGSFLAAFYAGLARGTFGYWMIAIGPYLIALVVRSLIGVGRGAAATD